jgi:hypothetical protein
MLTAEQVDQAKNLLAQRAWVARAKWDAVTSRPSSVHYGTQSLTPEPVDEQLAWAIEEFRRRRLDAIDAELKALGVEPPKPEPQ